MNGQGFQRMMLGWSLIFLGGGLLFVACPDTVIGFLNVFAERFSLGQPFPKHSDHLWLALSGSMMITIAYLSYQCFKDPANGVARNAVLISKLMSSIFFGVAFMRTANALYVGCLALDFSIFIVILVVYRRTLIK